MLRTTIAGAALGLLTISAAAAQRPAKRAATPVPSTTGLMLGAHSILASGISIQGPGMQGALRTNTGAGAGILVAYGFTPTIQAFASIDVAKQGTDMANMDGTMGLAHIEVGGRYSFLRPGKRLVPYVGGVIGRRSLGARSEGGGMSVTMRMTGSEYGAGGGFLYAFSPVLSLDAGVLATRGKFGHMKLSGDAQTEGDVNVGQSTSLRLKVGFQWNP
jgi:hypothetical protein